MSNTVFMYLPPTLDTIEQVPHIPSLSANLTLILVNGVLFLLRICLLRIQIYEKETHSIAIQSVCWVPTAASWESDMLTLNGDPFVDLLSLNGKCAALLCNCSKST